MVRPKSLTVLILCFNFFLLPKSELSRSSGVNQWRDQLKPTQILQRVAKVRGIPPPRMEGDGSSLTFSGRQYNLQEFGTAKFLFPFVKDVSRW